MLTIGISQKSWQGTESTSWFLTAAWSEVGDRLCSRVRIAWFLLTKRDFPITWHSFFSFVCSIMRLSAWLFYYAS